MEILKILITQISHSRSFLQEDMDGDNPVTSQPNPGQATSGMPAFAMPPPGANNPFASETSNLNQGGQRTYTPGERY